MSISRTPQIAPFPVWSTDQAPGVTRYSALPTPTSMRNKSLFGIPLYSTLTQQALSDDAIQSYINAAISEVEHALDIYITPVSFDEKYDYSRHLMSWSYNYIKLNHPNVLYVEKVELTFSNSPLQRGIIEFPLEFVHVMPQEGTIQLVPAFGTAMSGFLFSAFSGVQYHALNQIGMSEFPGGMRIKYTCGFEPGKVPALIAELIETMAALKVLSLMGPILFPNTSVGISIDGVSQSTGTLGPAFFRQRFDELSKLKDEQMDAAKGYYQRRFLVDFF